MSIVISFAPRARSEPAAAPGKPAQILFFTGVRYERQPEPVPADVQPRRRTRPSRAAARATVSRHPV